MVLTNVEQQGGQVDLDEDEEQHGTVEGAVEEANDVENRGQWIPGPLHQRKLICLPSRAEQERHRRCHIPFAPWCPE